MTIRCTGYIVLPMSSLGQRLRQERETRGLSLLQVEIDTRIRASIIQSLEEGNLELLPPEPFLRGLIRTYSNYLRIDPQEMLNLYVADTEPIPPPAPAPPPALQRPQAEPHAPAKRPPIQESDPNTDTPLPPARVSQLPAPQKHEPPIVPILKPECPEDPAVAPAPAPAPTAAASPRSIPEPFKAIRRRLPLAPPSAKPPKPALKPANPAPPPVTPPEILPPRDLIPVTRPSDPEPKPVPAPKALSTAQEIPEMVLAEPTEKPAPGPHKKQPRQFTFTQLKQAAEHLGHFPRTALVGVGLVVILILALVGFAIYSRLSPAVNAIAASQRTPSVTRQYATEVPTVPEDSTPTSIPTLDGTAPPFSTIASVATTAPTAKATPVPRPTTSGGALELTISAAQPVTAQIGIDGALIFNGPIAAGTELSWSAKESLYLHVENFIGATVTFNGRKQVPLNFPERTIFERQWNMGPNGRPVYATPLAPGIAPAATPVSSIQLIKPTDASTATRPLSTPTLTPAPTPTLTPFS